MTLEFSAKGGHESILRLAKANINDPIVLECCLEALVHAAADDALVEEFCFRRVDWEICVC